MGAKKILIIGLLLTSAVIAYLWMSQPVSPIRSQSQDIGYFWQVSDFHYDVKYSSRGDPSKKCHDSSSGDQPSSGKYGEYTCDSPWNLVLSTMSAMKDINSKPDFILWTGDAASQLRDSKHTLNSIFDIIHKITEALLDHFPDVRIFPTFGNNDAFPKGQMPVNDPHYYSSILIQSNWAKLVPPSSRHTFKKGGYYSYVASPKFRIIAVNTAVYCKCDRASEPSPDPNDQFRWFAKELQKAKLAGQKVYLVGHIPPGTFELAPRVRLFHEQFNEKYLDIIDGYKDIILAQFYAHDHTDSFRLFGDKDGDSTVMFVSPAVTPLESAIPGIGSVNPSFRLYAYNKTTFDILDYHHYYLNLTQAKKAAAKWKLEYQFTTTYDVDNLKSAAVKQVVEKTVDGSKNKYLSRYLKYNSVSFKEGLSCNKTCIQGHRCSMLYQRYPQIDECLSSSSLRQYMTWKLSGPATGVLVFAIIATVLSLPQRTLRKLPMVSQWLVLFTK